MRKILTFLTLSTMVFNIQVTQAQPVKQVSPIQRTQKIKSVCSDKPPITTLKIIDAQTSVCRVTFPQSEGWSDWISVIRKREDGNTDFSVSIGFFDDGRSIVTLWENNEKICKNDCMRLAQFELVGRKFSKWLPNLIRPDLLNKYRQYVTLVLDVHEQNPVFKPEF